MRVGIDYRPALTSHDGIGRYTRELVRALVELGFDRSLGLFGYTLSPSRFSPQELGLENSQAELVRLRFPSRWLPGLLRTLGKGVDDLVGGTDVYHHTQYNLLTVRRSAEVATIHDCIYLHNVEYMAPETAERMSSAARSMVQRARRILVPSLFTGGEVVLRLGAHPSRVVHAPLGCDHVLRELPPEGFPAPLEPYVLTVSRVDPRKNHVRILRAFELLVREGLPHRWVIVGSRGWNAEGFLRALANSPAQSRVEWRENASERELIQLYAQASVLVFPSLTEGYGLPVIEAMALGVPVVTSCVAAMPEVAGDCALLVEPTDTERIFEAVRRLLAEPDLASELSSRGKERARQFTWRACARTTLSAFQAATQPDESRSSVRGAS